MAARAARAVSPFEVVVPVRRRIVVGEPLRQGQFCMTLATADEGAWADPASARHTGAVPVVRGSRRHVASVASLRRIPSAPTRRRSQRHRQFALGGSGRHDVGPL